MSMKDGRVFNHSSRALFAIFASLKDGEVVEDHFLVNVLAVSYISNLISYCSDNRLYSFSLESDIKYL